jgi:hypothetical protein
VEERMTAEKFQARKPDYVLSVKVKDTTSKRRCGAGWLNDDGSVSIQLDPCTVLSWKDNIHITLFSAEK